MCVIIEKQPGFLIPHNMLDTACDINKHGFGISYINKGKLKTIKKADTPNDPKVIADILEPLKDVKVYIHLRHATVGDVVMMNCHPFDVSPAKRYQVQMMHNGTLWGFSPDKTSTPLDSRSDTLIFATKVVAPLIQRGYAYLGDKVLEDEFTIKILRSYITQNSVVVFFDNKGRSIRFNKSQGKDFEGFWASNDYSFQQSHYRSSTKTYNPTHQNAGQYRYMGEYGKKKAMVNEENLPWREADMSGVSDSSWSNWDEFNRTGGKPDVALLPKPDQSEIQTLKFEIEKIKDKIATSQYTEKSVMAEVTNVDLSVKKASFLERCGISDIDSLAKLSTTDLEELCENYPKGMADAFTFLLCDLINVRDTVIELKKKGV